MDPFETLQDIWKSKQVAPQVQMPSLGPTAIHSRRKLQRNLQWGAIALLITGFYIIIVGILMRQEFHSVLTWTGLSLAVLVCWAQSFLQFSTLKKLRAIDEMATPDIHLSQWNDYYAFRKKQIAWNLPLYFIGLNLALALYMLELFKGRPWENIAIFITIYTAWMLFAYFYLGKRSQRKEENRLRGIMDNLEALKAQWAEE